jgi:predicted transcriptional regulator of viral defense system
MKLLNEQLPDYIDYNWLMHRLRGYAAPRAKITSMLARKELVRVKKGLYIAGDNRNYSRSLLANLIYGPSYILFEYALSWYGVIPGRVYAVTSACAKKNKRFSTPLGEFNYSFIPRVTYAAGVRMERDGANRFLIGTVEKVLADMVYRNREIRVNPDTQLICYSTHPANRTIAQRHNNPSLRYREGSITENS